MRERLLAPLRRRRSFRIPWTLFVGVVVGFVAIVGANLRPPDPESRLPASYRLTALIERQQLQNEQQGQVVEDLRRQRDTQQTSVLSRRSGLSNLEAELDGAGVAAGTGAVRGLGFTVSLDDSTLEDAPTGNVNDLVIHSQDVQAVVNAMWASGAEAVSINGQRLVSTSAILCVGNTLLLNGTVHSPPYEISGVAANRAQFSDDPLVKQLKGEVERFSLGLSTGRDEVLEIPPYTGRTTLRYARVAAQP